MDDLIEQIRAATLPDASTESRTAAARACRTILATVEPEVAPSAPPPPPPPPREAPAPIAGLDPAAVMSALRGMPPDQLLDLAIARLRAALPAGAAQPEVTPIRFTMVPVAGLPHALRGAGP